MSRLHGVGLGREPKNPKYGPKRIEQELKAKGVGQPLIMNAIDATFARGDEEKNAKTLLDKNFTAINLGDPKTLRRACAFLAASWL